MPHDPQRVAEVRGWFAKARSDLHAAEHGLTAEPPIVDDAVFHCQQAAEKTLKGFLTWHDCPFRRTHSLEELGEQCLGLDPTLRAIIDRAVPLTEYAWRFRYPGDPEMPSLKETTEALAVARTVLETILDRLPRAVRH